MDDQVVLLIDSIVRLRRAERAGDATVRSDITPVRESLEDLVGPTIRPAQAARLLGISQPALSRWIDEGDVATVLTPESRREIPLMEIVALVEDVEHLRSEGFQRPVSRAIRDRHRRSQETIDLDRLFPERKRGHRAAELQSLAYHRAVAERLDEHIVDNARRRVHRWRDEGRVHPRWIDEWETVLSKPLPQVARAIGADTPAARALRQTSPFAGVLSEQERRRVLDAVEGRL